MTRFITRRALGLLPLSTGAAVASWPAAAACPKPPRMELRVRGRRQRGARGTYCWGDGSRGCCVDTGPVYPYRPLYLYPGESPELHFADLSPVAELGYEIESSRIVVVDGGRWWDDAPGPEPTQRVDIINPRSPVRLPGDLPHGLYLVGVFAFVAGGGDTWQGFRLYVGPDRLAATPTAGATPVPVAQP